MGRSTNKMVMFVCEMTRRYIYIYNYIYTVDPYCCCTLNVFFLPIVILSISDFISQEYPVNILLSFYFGFFKQLHRAITLGKNLSI